MPWQADIRSNSIPWDAARDIAEQLAEKIKHGQRIVLDAEPFHRTFESDRSKKTEQTTHGEVPVVSRLEAQNATLFGFNSEFFGTSPHFQDFLAILEA